MARFKEYTKHLSKVLSAIKDLDKEAIAPGDEVRIASGALSSLRALDVAQLGSYLGEIKELAEQRLTGLLSERRAGVEASARSAALSYRRYADHDRVDLFVVQYANTRVKLMVGSEELVAFEEVHGANILQRILAEQERLKNLMLPREEFFRALKRAIAMARADGAFYDGKVKVKELLPYVVAARLLTSEKFRTKQLIDPGEGYSLAVFAYELRAFGDHADGWVCGTERLCNQGPNMATQREALKLPDRGDASVQVLWLWIDKSA